MTGEPRLRVSALLRWKGRLLLIRHEKGGREAWLLPGGGVAAGESLIDALRRELAEEVGLVEGLSFEGPVAIVESIPPERTPPGKHVVHIVFAADLGDRSLEGVSSVDVAVRGRFLIHDVDPWKPAVTAGALIRWSRGRIVKSQAAQLITCDSVLHGARLRERI